MNSIDDLAHMDNKSKLGKVGYVLGRMILGGMIFLSAGMAYKACFAPKTINDVTIVENGREVMYEAIFNDATYFNTITTDDDKCFIVSDEKRGQLEEGDHLKSLKYKLSIRHMCNYLESYEK